MRIKFIGNILCFVIAAMAVGCGKNPAVSVLTSWDDSRVTPLLKIALDTDDRSSSGLTAIDRTGALYLQYGDKKSDVILHIDNPPTIRVVSFRKMNNGYRWIGETEVHLGPNANFGPDRVVREGVLIAYQLEAIVDGVPTNRPFIRYYGPDMNWSGRTNLTIEDVKPLLAKWREKR